MTGNTDSSDFPTTPGAFDTTFNGNQDGFVTKLNASGSALEYSTFLGGSGYDGVYGIAVDSSGSAHVTGNTDSSDFPTTQGAFDRSTGGDQTFVTKLNGSGSVPEHSTLLGGSGDQSGLGIALGSSGSAFVTGYTYSSDFPTTPGAFDRTFGGGTYDGFVTKLDLSFPTAAMLVPYRANLHTHTAYSDGGIGIGGDSPADAFQRGRSGGLDAMAVTDHGEQLTTGEWGSLMRDAEIETTGGFVALPGFEWTHTFSPFGWLAWLLDPISYLATGQGHINVYGSTGRSGAYDDGVGLASGDLRTTLDQFYGWLAAAPAIDTDRNPYNRPVAQFNHPTTYDNCDHFNDVAMAANASLRDVLCLMEIGSHRYGGYDGGAADNGSGDPNRDNEFWFRRALNNGWRVAPTNNGDNHTTDYAFGTSPPVFTGIFAAPLPPNSTAHERQSRLLDALRARRTFASEDRDAQVILTADAGLAPQPWWMGQAVTLPPATPLTFRVEAHDQTDPIAKVELIRIPGTPGEPLRSWPGLNANSFDQSHSATAAEMAAWPVTVFGEAWVYAKVTEADGDLLYSAPIWVGLPGSHSAVTAPPVSCGAQAVLRSWLKRVTGGRADDPLAGRPVLFRVEGAPVGTVVTDANGQAAFLYNVPEGELSLRFTAEFAGDADAGASFAESVMVVDGARTTMYSLDRVGTITETVLLRGYLRRATDNAWLPDRTVAFKIDGTVVGEGVTNADGRADFVWRISDGAPTRSITALFEGDAQHLPSSASATLTCQSWTTKMATLNRAARITDRTELKCRLLRSDNVPLYQKAINFYVDGTFVISRNTDISGYAKYPYYTIPDGAGAGVRTILSEWPGNGGYAAISRTATLTVNKAIPCIWVLPKTVPRGATANLYSYFRRLYDYQKQAGKTVDFKIDGTVVQTVVTDGNGVARYLYQTTEPVGVYTIRCEFYGDAWLDPAYGEANLTIY